jgi:hypothetical protein
VPIDVKACVCCVVQYRSNKSFARPPERSKTDAVAKPFSELASRAIIAGMMARLNLWVSRGFISVIRRNASTVKFAGPSTSGFSLSQFVMRAPPFASDPASALPGRRAPRLIRSASLASGGR